MMMSTIAGAAKRRWWLVLIVLAAGTWFGWEESQEVEAVYSAYGSALLSGYDDSGTHQLTSSDPRLMPTAEIMAGLLMDDDIAKEVSDAGGAGAEYIVETRPDSPLLTIDAEGDSPESAVATVQGVLELVPEELAAAIASDAPAHEQAQPITLREPSDARTVEPESEFDEVTYRAVGTVLLVAPGEAVVSATDAALRAPSRVLAEAVQSDDEVAGLVGDGATTFTVEAAESGPLMRVSTLGEQDEVEPMIGRVMDRMEELLAENPEFTGGMELMLTDVASLGKEHQNASAPYQVIAGFSAAGLALGTVAALVLDVIIALLVSWGWTAKVASVVQRLARALVRKTKQLRVSGSR